ncbi:methionine ABC transporter ATP-binding protein [Nakamurella sp. A5-74]|uniref:Methionine ABC transporter ATP-binding protein n=1 Tax=Nakamurella sp. A5-74 TaxID=3158264 RepID=A0AAU8DRW4_9ACTN
MNAHITFRGVSKVFATRGGADVVAVRDVDLVIDRGEIHAVIGYSGAGKSTLVRLINGLEHPTTGSIVIDGTEIAGLSERALRPIRAGIGMIFQQFNLFRSRTVVGNITYPLRIAGWSKERREKRAAELLSFVGLTDKAWTYPDQLSGGQRQRVGIARALATGPQILLADESTSALDPETTRDVLALLRRINAELGVTVVIITHEMEVVRSIADRVTILDAGGVAESGTVEEVFLHPRTAVARRFVSSVVGTTDTGVDAPVGLLGSSEKTLRPSGSVPRVLQLSTTDTAALGRAMSAVARDHGIDVEIIGGGIVGLKHSSVADLTVQLHGSDEAIARAASDLALIGGPR